MTDNDCVFLECMKTSLISKVNPFSTDEGGNTINDKAQIKVPVTHQSVDIAKFQNND
jgi:hypothetical protein